MDGTSRSTALHNFRRFKRLGADAKQLDLRANQSNESRSSTVKSKLQMRLIHRKVLSGFSCLRRCLRNAFFDEGTRRLETHRSKLRDKFQLVAERSVQDRRRVT